MPSKRQEEFIRLNRSLSPEQLSVQTGLRLHQVHKLLRRLEAETQAPSQGPDDQGLWGFALLPVIVTLLFYLPVLGNGFTNWDDPKYILNNPHIRSLDASFFQWSWTTFEMGNWMPLTWFSLALDDALGGFNPLVYHLHNLFLHLLNTFLVFYISFKVLGIAERLEPGGKGLGRMGAVSTSLLTALLFGVHPLHVESVAWAAERKDVLCGFYFLLSLWFYLEYATRPGRKRWAWAACLAAFALALLSKPMAISLPLVFLLLDLWPLGRIKAESPGIWIEKTPFFILSLGACVLAPLAQTSVHGLHDLPFDFRLMNSFHSLFFYLWKTMAPAGLCPYYPLPGNPAAFTGMNLISCLSAFLVSALCFLERKRRPFLGIAWLYYLLTLSPVLGLVQIGFQAAADRYTYLPLFGPFLLLSGIVSAKLRGRRWAILTVGILLVLVLGTLTARQIGVWKSSLDLWEYEKKTSQDVSDVPPTKLAETYLDLGRTNDALAEFDRAIALAPNNDSVHVTKGVLLRQMGEWDQAAGEFKKAIALNPANNYAHCNLGLVDLHLGLKDEAVSEAQEAVKLNPQFTLSYVVLGMYYSGQKDYEKAEEAFQNAVRLDPFNPDWAQDLASVYSSMGRLDEAVSWYQKELQLEPGNAVGYLNLGRVLAVQGKRDLAREVLGNADRLGPKDPAFYEELSRVYSKNQQPGEASACFKKAQGLKAAGYR